MYKNFLDLQNFQIINICRLIGFEQMENINIGKTEINYFNYLKPIESTNIR